MEFWRGRLKRVKLVVDQAADLQQKWGRKVDPRTQSPTGEFNFVAMLSLVGQYNIGGKSWLQQFFWGFPIAGGLGQSGVYSADPKDTKAPDPPEIWTDTVTRCRTRAKASGWPHGDHMWNESMGQVEKGRLSTPPLPLTPMGNALSRLLAPSTFRSDLRMGQMGKLRACDGIKYGAANLYCSVWKPTKLPTWGHIAQLAASSRQTKCDWSFFKTAHEGAYKQLPLSPEDRLFSAVSLRRPKTRDWMAFAPRTLLFGAAALRYNCFSREAAALFAKVAGILLLIYFGDFGSIVPSDVLGHALQEFVTFCELLRLKLKPPKTKNSPALPF